MKRISTLSGFICMLIIVTSYGAAESYQGSKAPRFELPVLSGAPAGYTAGDYADSEDIFGHYGITFLVFWDSECPHCVESLAGCEQFSRGMGGGSVGVVGISTGGSRFGVQEGLERSGATFPQLYDREGRTVREYGGPAGGFSIFTVDGRGIILEGVVEPGAETEPVMMRMYAEATGGVDRDSESAVAITGRVRSQQALGSDFMFSGDVRIRFLSADVKGEGAVGPYGEEILPGNELLRRLHLRISRKIGNHITAGGLLRISNEDPEVLEYGPYYLDNEWGSVFAAWSRAGFSLRAGYYPIHLTPLTMMRWDWNDNPRIGGNAGCGSCGAGSSGLFFRTLEELGPELYFEGGKLSYQNRFSEVDIFYGIPRRAKVIGPVEAAYTGTKACYSLESYGASFRLRGGGRLPWKLSFNFAGSREDERTVPAEKLYGHPFEKYTSQVYSVTGRLSVAEGVSVGGEFVPLSRTVEDNSGMDYNESRTYEGWGGYGGIALEEIQGLSARLDYIHLKKDMIVPFMALSYLPGMAGYRLSADYEFNLRRWSSLPEAVSCSVFYKRLSEVDVPDVRLMASPSILGWGGMQEENVSFAGISFNVVFSENLNAGFGYIDRGNWRDGNIEEFDSKREVYSGSLNYSFSGRASAEMQYMRIDVSDDSSGEKLQSESDIFSLYSVIEF